MPAPEPDGGGEGAPGPLGARIARRIAHQGAMTLAEYMATVLTDPAHGYYMARDPFGARGDFVTAPEVSQMFGELIGLWCAETWARLGKPDPLHLVELGPGRGTLIADALRAARVAPGFVGALRLHLVEVSPALRGRQQDALRGLADALAAPPRWHESLAGVPEGPLLLIANEFFDALPIRQFVRRPPVQEAGREAVWFERVVTLAADGKGLAFGLRPAALEAAALLPAHADQVPPEGTFEVSPAGIGLATEIGRRMRVGPGAALILDYGAARAPGEATLQALRGHDHHDILAAPGRADLSAHVDFAALAGAASEAGAKAWGPVTQGAFLGALGLAARAEALGRANPDHAPAIAAAVDRLTGDERMGALFKALALTGPALGRPAGFESWTP